MIKALLRSVYCLGLAIGIASNSLASITSFGLDADGGGNSFTTVDTLDWGPDNALSKDGLTAIRNFLAGAGSTTLTTYTQGSLSSVRLNGSNVVLAPYGEITFVAGITETVTAAASLGGNVVATFGLSAGPVNFFEIYQGAANANQLAGTGYNNGTLIMSGIATSFQGVANYFQSSATANLDNFGADNYPLIDTFTGNGSTSIVGLISYIDPLYFSGLTAGETISFFSTNQANPFNLANPASRFAELPGGVAPVLDGAGAPATSIGTLNGSLLAGFPDVQYQTDAASTFSSVVPEPTSLLVWGGMVGLIGAMATWRRVSVKV